MILTGKALTLSFRITLEYLPGLSKQTGAGNSIKAEKQPEPLSLQILSRRHIRFHLRHCPK